MADIKISKLMHRKNSVMWAGEMVDMETSGSEFGFMTST